MTAKVKVALEGKKGQQHLMIAPRCCCAAWTVRMRKPDDELSTHCHPALTLPASRISYKTVSGKWFGGTSDDIGDSLLATSNFISRRRYCVRRCTCCKNNHKPLRRCHAYCCYCCYWWVWRQYHNMRCFKSSFSSSSLILPHTRSTFLCLTSAISVIWRFSSFDVDVECWWV